MSAISKLQIIIEAITKDADKDLDSTKNKLNDVDKAAKKAADGTDKTSQSMKKLKDALSTAGVAIAGFIAYKFAEFMKDSVTAASNMAETVNKVAVVFGESADEIYDWAETAATSLGMSEEAALAAAGTYGNLFTSMGMGVDVAADMSTGLVQLAADLASFNNIDPTEALDALRSGLVGEVEPLRKLGVNLNQVTIEAEAMALGLMEVGDELTASAKAQASYSLILKQTGNAQGDFARTSDSLANQQRTLKASVDDLKAAIGEDLVPAMEDATKSAIDFIDTLLTNREVIDTVREAEEEGILTRKEANEILYKYRQGIVDADTVLLDLNTSLEEQKTKQEEATQAIIDAAKEYENEYGMVDEATRATDKFRGMTNDAATALAGVGETIGNNTIPSLQNLYTALSDADTMMGSYNEKLIYNTVSAGLNEEQQLLLAESMGLIDDKTRLAIAGIAGLTKEYDLDENGVIDATEATDEYILALAELKGIVDSIKSKDVYVNVYTNYTSSGEGYEGEQGGFKYKATGGPVMANEPYIVGERGPELFIPRTDGTIVPNNTINNSFNINLTGTGNASNDVMSSVRLLELLYG